MKKKKGKGDSKSKDHSGTYTYRSSTGRKKIKNRIKYEAFCRGIFFSSFPIFPEGKTVIMIGKRICRGALRGVEEGTNFGDYAVFGRNWLEDEFLSLACYDLVRFLEDNGWEACPIFPNPSELGPSGVSVADGRPAPNVYPDFDYAAVACGLGEIGLNGLFLSPKFGSRQRFHMILTDAEIEETPLFEGSICDKCGKCADACPLGAVDKVS